MMYHCTDTGLQISHHEENSEKRKLDSNGVFEKEEMPPQKERICGSAVTALTPGSKCLLPLQMWAC